MDVKSFLLILAIESFVVKGVQGYLCRTPFLCASNQHIVPTWSDFITNDAVLPHQSPKETLDVVTELKGSIISLQKEFELSSDKDKETNTVTLSPVESVCDSACENLSVATNGTTETKSCDCLPSERERNRTTWERKMKDNGWFVASNGLAYKLSSDDKNCDDAEEACKAEDSRLASTGIRNESVRNKLWKTVFNETALNTWIGLREVSTDLWVWSDGAEYSMNSTPWGGSSPNNHGCCDCAAIWFQYTTSLELNDWKKRNAARFLCENWCRSC